MNYKLSNIMWDTLYIQLNSTYLTMEQGNKFVNFWIHDGFTD